MMACSPLLSDADLLELAGENSLAEVKELTLRNQRLTDFSPYCAKLPNLEALSLSHNQVTSLQVGRGSRRALGWPHRRGGMSTVGRVWSLSQLCSLAE